MRPGDCFGGVRQDQGAARLPPHRVAVEWDGALQPRGRRLAVTCEDADIEHFFGCVNGGWIQQAVAGIRAVQPGSGGRGGFALLF